MNLGFASLILEGLNLEVRCDLFTKAEKNMKKREDVEITGGAKGCCGFFKRVSQCSCLKLPCARKQQQLLKPESTLGATEKVQDGLLKRASRSILYKLDSKRAQRQRRLAEIERNLEEQLKLLSQGESIIEQKNQLIAMYIEALGTLTKYVQKHYPGFSFDDEGLCLVGSDIDDSFQESPLGKSVPQMLDDSSRQLQDMQRQYGEGELELEEMARLTGEFVDMVDALVQQELPVPVIEL